MAIQGIPDIEEDLMRHAPLPYPLVWPDKVARTEKHRRKSGRFSMTETGAVREINRNLNLMRAGNCLISTDKQRFSDAGNPVSGNDPGVAVYFTHKSQERVVAIDLYSSTQANLCAMANTLDALRTLERHGGVNVFEQAMQGFDVAELPARRRPWHEVLRVYPDSALSVIDAAYRDQAKIAHPDTPTGSTAAFQELQEAYEEAKKERSK